MNFSKFSHILKSAGKPIVAEEVERHFERLKLRTKSLSGILSGMSSDIRET
jgi:hypothetical protein